jgi:CHAT domain-containing protein/tetratricopeptide (TPR) repeat protein
MHLFSLSSLVVAGLVLGLASPGLPGDVGSAATLQPDAAIRGSIAGGQLRRFKIAAAANEVLEITMRTRGVTVAVTLKDMEGRALIEAFPVNDRATPPDLLWLPAANTEQTLEMHCTEPATRTGRFELRRRPRRSPEPEDGQRLAAQAAWVEGRNLIDTRKNANMRKAQQRFEEGLALARLLEDPLMEGRFLENLALTHFILGEREQSLTLHLQAYEKLKGRDRHTEAVTLFQLGINYRLAADFQRSLDYFTRARDLFRAEGNGPAEARVLNQLSSLYNELHDFRKSLSFALQAQSILRGSGVPYDAGAAADSAGTAYTSLGEFDKALAQYQRSIVIAEKAGLGKALAISVGNMGGVYMHLKQYDKALELFQRGLALHQKEENRVGEAHALSHIGGVYRELGQYEKALEYLHQSMSRAEVVGEKLLQMDSLLAAAKCERDRGDMAEARRLVESLTHLFETARGNVVSEELRVGYSNLAREAYDVDVDVLMKLHAREPQGGFAAAAFEASERSRSRALLELLHDAHVSGAAGVDPDLLEREVTTRRELSAKAALQLPGGRTSRPPEEVSQLEADIARLSREHDDVRSRIREQQPRYAALNEPASCPLSEVQALLDPDTALIEYHLGAERSYVWMVNRDTLVSAELPNAAEIERQGRALYDDLTVRTRPAAGLSAAANLRRLEDTSAHYTRAAQRLSEVLLGPLPKPSVQRLVIVADGVLHYLPFAALPVPASWASGGSNPGEPLLTSHAVVSLPSAAVIAALRSERAARAPAPKEIAVFADPVFDTQDGRLTRRPGPHPAVPVSPSADVPADALSLPRLSFTRELADTMVEGLAPGVSFKAVGFDASRSSALAAGLDQYRTVVFATHGLLNTEYPELSGIALSMVNEKGEKLDGFLRLADVYDMRLNAELVVLAACETALGKEAKGEGLLGLSRGFFYAGSSRVVASLWKVDEDATVALLQEFHRGVSRGKPFPFALRDAQLYVSRQPRWRNPYFWAGFILQGEWR